MAKALEELERAVEGAPNTWDCTAEGELVALSWAVATVDLTRSSGAAPKQMLLWPPGGAWSRVVGRSVMTLPQFWSEPLAKALDDCETVWGCAGRSARRGIAKAVDSRGTTLGPPDECRSGTGFEAEKPRDDGAECYLGHRVLVVEVRHGSCDRYVYLARRIVSMSAEYSKKLSALDLHEFLRTIVVTSADPRLPSPQPRACRSKHRASSTASG